MPMPNSPPVHRGFTLAEALVAITILALAGSAILLSVDTSASSVDDALYEAQAHAIAEILVEEALAKPYAEPGSTSLPTQLGKESGETSSPQQTVLFDDTDDYHFYFNLNSVRDEWGIPITESDGAGGSRHLAFRIPDSNFAIWAVTCTVYYVNENDLSSPAASGTTSNFRRIQARCWRRPANSDWQMLAEASQVFTYVRPPN